MPATATATILLLTAIIDPTVLITGTPAIYKTAIQCMITILTVDLTVTVLVSEMEPSMAPIWMEGLGLRPSQRVYIKRYLQCLLPLREQSYFRAQAAKPNIYRHKIIIRCISLVLLGKFWRGLEHLYIIKVHSFQCTYQ